MTRLIVFGKLRRTTKEHGSEGGESAVVLSATEQPVLPPTQLAITTQPGGAADSVVFTQQPVVEVRNALNALVTDAVFGVTAAVLSGSGTVIGTTTVNTVSGVATFTNLQIVGGSGSHAIRFSASGLTPADSTSFTVAQTATKLAITTQPSGGADGVAFTTQPVVEVRDAQNARVTTSTKVVTASILSGGGSGSLTGTSVAAVNGVATFTTLQLSGGSGSVVLRFSATGLTGADASATTIAQTATQLVVTTQPSSSITSGQAWPVQPVVEVRDAQNVKVSTATHAVTVSQASGTASLLGTLTVNAVAGVATFAGLTLSGTGANQVRFDASGLTGVIANTITIASSPALLLQEDCEDNNLATRGWYDLNGQPFTTSALAGDHAVGARGMLASFTQGGTKPTWSAARRLISPATSFYLTYRRRVSSNYVGSGQAYHPHEFEFLTDQDGDDYQSPAINRLGIYMESNYSNGEWPSFTWQDAANIDTNNIGVDLTGITENRAVAGCNGNSGAGSAGVCFNAGGGYQNGKTLKSASAAISAANKTNWHLWEWYFQLNTISGGVGQANGIAQCWVNGVLVLNYTNVLFRTNQRPNMKFNQLLWQPYIGDGSPAAQSIAYDDIKVYTYRPSTPPLVPSALAFTTTPSTAVNSGQTLAQQPVLQIRTSTGTLVADSTMSVFATVQSGSATLGGTTQVAAVNGVATFTNLSLTGSGSVVLRFTCNGFTVDASAITVSGGAQTATQLVITQQPSASVTSGVAFPTQPRVEVRDAANVRVAGNTAAVTASVATGTGALSGTTSVNAVDGTATFTNLVLTGGSQHTLQFSAGVLTPATSATVSVGGFQTPNIVLDASFETDFGTAQNFSGGPPTGCDRSQAQAHNGSWSLHQSLSVNGSGQCGYFFSGVGEVWIAFWLYLSSLNMTDCKFIRIYGNHGGLWVSGNSVHAGWDDENASVISPIGLTSAEVAGQWIHLETRLQRNGSTYPRMEFWVNGSQRYAEFNGNSTVQYHLAGQLPGNPNNRNNTTWINGVMDAGMRSSSASIQGIMIWPTLNSVSGTAHSYIDNLSISTLGRIGVRG